MELVLELLFSYYWNFLSGFMSKPSLTLVKFVVVGIMHPLTAVNNGRIGGCYWSDRHGLRLHLGDITTQPPDLGSRFLSESFLKSGDLSLLSHTTLYLLYFILTQFSFLISPLLTFLKLIRVFLLPRILLYYYVLKCLNFSFNQYSFYHLNYQTWLYSNKYIYL